MSNQGASPSEQAEARRHFFVAGLPGRLEQLDTAARPIATASAADKIPDALEVLRGLTRTLTEAAAASGYPALSAAARDMERACCEVLEAACALTPPRRQRLEHSLGHLKRAITETLAENGTEGREVEAPDAEPLARHERSVILLADEGPRADKLAADLGSFGVRVHQLRQAAELEGALAGSTPTAVVENLHSEADEQAAFETFERLHGRNALPCPVIVVTARTDLRTRLAAVRAGVDSFLVEPIDALELMEALDILTAQDDTAPYRILIVEDDQGAARASERVLQGAGMMTSVVTDPMEVMERLDAFSPELIMMRSRLSDCDGEELASVIRQEKVYTGIPILFLSAEADPGGRHEAMSHDGDGVLAVPLEPGHLIASVKARVRRFRMLRSLMVRDSMTGLFNHSTTKQVLETEVARARRENSAVALVALDLDRFKWVNDTYGHGVGDHVIKSLARLLRQRLRSVDAVGRMGGEEFAAVLTRTDGAQALAVFEQIRKAFEEIDFRDEDREFSVTFSCGIADFPRFGNVAALSDAADKALYAAKRAGRNRVVLAD